MSDKIVLHVNRYGCYRGGTESYVREIAQHMREYKHYLLYGSDGDKEYLTAFTDSYNMLQKEDKYSRDIVRKLNPNYVIIYNIGNRSMVVFFELRQDLGFKIIKSFHDYRMIYVGTGYNRITLRRMRDPMGWHSILGCVTRDAFTRKIKLENLWLKKKLLAEVNKANAVEIHTEDMRRTLIRNGINQDKIYWNPPWGNLMEKKDIEPEPTTILFVGNLIRGKGLRLLLKALRKVRRSYALKIAGAGYERKKLERYAKNHGINAIFLGHIPKEKLSDLYSSSLFVVFPSILEPFGFVIVEAMSHKRAVIAFNTGSTAETIQDGVNGYLVRAFDIDKLTEKIEYLFENPDIALTMGQKGHEIFLSKFTIEHHLQRLRKKLLELEN